MKKLFLCAASLLLLTGCGSTEVTTTQTTAQIPTTTEAPTTEAKANKNDQFIDDLANKNIDFSIIDDLYIIESDEVNIIDVKTSNGFNFVTACEVMTGALQEADYYKGYDLWIRYASGDNNVEWTLDPSSNYEKGMLTSSNTNPILDVTLDDIRKAFENNTTEE